MKDDSLKTDLQLEFPDGGDIDLAWPAGEATTVSGALNLVQALTMRLLVHRGELPALRQPRPRADRPAADPPEPRPPAPPRPRRPPR
jgi:hypothetical protein